MTRGFHHPAETFFKNHLHAARSCSRPPKICRLQPSAGYVGLCRGTQKSFIRSSTRRGADPARKPVKTTFNTLSLNILYLHISNLSLLLRHEKGLQHGIEKGHRGGPGETHPKTQAAPSGYGARRGSREGPQAA